VLGIKFTNYNTKNITFSQNVTKNNRVITVVSPEEVVYGISAQPLGVNKNIKKIVGCTKIFLRTLRKNRTSRKNRILYGNKTV
jgi:hypothetical protein